MLAVWSMFFAVLTFVLFICLNPERGLDALIIHACLFASYALGIKQILIWF